MIGAPVHGVAKPLRRIVVGLDSTLVLEVTDMGFGLRPRRTKAGGPASVFLTWGRLYERALVERAGLGQFVTIGLKPKRRAKARRKA